MIPIELKKARKDRHEEKLAPNWELLYLVVDSLHNVAYKLKELNDKLLLRN